MGTTLRTEIFRVSVAEKETFFIAKLSRMLLLAHPSRREGRAHDGKVIACFFSKVPAWIFRTVS